MGAVDVRDETHGEVAPAERPERLAGHRRPEVGPADADVHNGANGLAGMAPPFAVADLVREGGHVGQDAIHPGHDIAAVHHYRAVGAVAQGHVQNRAFLGDIDGLAIEHCADSGREIALPRQGQQAVHGLVGDTVLGVVQEQTGGFKGVTRGAARVIPEEVAQVDIAHCAVVVGERFPGGKAVTQQRTRVHAGLMFFSSRVMRSPTVRTLTISLASSSTWKVC